MMEINKAINSFSNYFMMCANMPLGPGSPLSPFSEYASVSKSREKPVVSLMDGLI